MMEETKRNIPDDTGAYTIALYMILSKIKETRA